MGLPSTTAMVLVACGLERGIDEAAEAAESCMVGLAASLALPLAYARAASAGWRAPSATAAAVAGYVTVAVVLWWVPKPDAAGCLAFAAAGVAAAYHLRTPTRFVGAFARGRCRTLSLFERLAYRTAVPTGYFLLIRSLRSLAGAGLAGRFITFPGGSLTVLVTTHLEAGPEAACQLAAVMPTGGLVMLAFLASFRYACPAYGLGWGTTIGFTVALVTLNVIGALMRPQEPAQPLRKPRSPRAHTAQAAGRPIRSRSGSTRRESPSRSGGRPRGPVRRQPRPPRSRFAPRVEVLAG